MNHRGVIVVVFRMVVGFTATFAISVYHHWSCEFEFHSGEVYLIELYVIKFQWLATGWWFSPGTPVSSTNKTDCHNITFVLLQVARYTMNYPYILCFIFSALPMSTTVLTPTLNPICKYMYLNLGGNSVIIWLWGLHHGYDCMVVGFTTTYAISTYHYWSCDFESGSGVVYSTQHYVIKYVSDLRQVGDFLCVL